jgi:putative ABC transport system permease protein
MMLRTALSALLSHWRWRPVQLLTLVLGLAMATALWSAVQTINSEARASYARAAAILGQNRLSQLVRADGARMDQQVFVNLRKGGWLVSPLLEGTRRFGDTRVRLIGLDPLSSPPQARQLDLSEPGSLRDFIAGSGVLYAAPETAAKLRAHVKQALRDTAAVPPGIVLTDIGQAQELLEARGQFTSLVLWPEQPLTRLPLNEIAPELRQRDPSKANDLARLTDSFHLNLTAFAFLSFAVGLFIVHATIGLAFEQRRPVFRTLRALGLPAHALIGLLLGELLMFALLAGLLGVGLGYVIAAALLPDVAATLRGLYGASVEGSVALRGSAIAAGLAISFIGTLIAGGQGLWKVWSLPLLISAQPQAWVRASERALRIQFGLAAALFMVAMGFGLFASGLIWGFLLLAALLLASALLLPLLLMTFLKLGQRFARRPISEWFWADSRQQLSGLSLSLMALLLALAANVGVGTMVSSFRQTFVGWLDQRLASELYVTARSDQEAATIKTWLASRADAVLPIWNIETEIDGLPATIYGVADHATYRDNWPLLSSETDVWDRLARGEGILVNEQLARRQKYRLGDSMTLPGGWQTRIVGIYSDYGNPTGQVMIGIDQLLKRYPDAPRLRYAIRIDPLKAQALAEEMRTTFDLPEQNIIDQAAIKTLSLSTFDRTFTVTAALNVLTLGVAGLAMFASLLTLSSMRLAQVAPVWAMGVSRRRLATLEVGRSVLLAALTAIVALPLGLGLAWVLLSVVNVEAFGWRLHMYLFPGEWLRLGGLALLAAALAAVLPAISLARLTPTQLLKVFADER